jgi:hypothetical protein
MIVYNIYHMRLDRIAKRTGTTLLFYKPGSDRSVSSGTLLALEAEAGG